MSRLILRDMRLAFARGWGWVTGTIFYLVFVALVALAVGGVAPVLSAIGPGVAWAGVLFGVILMAPGLFSDDLRNGAIDQLRLDGASLTQVVGARMVSLALLSLTPLLLASLVIGQLLFLRDGQTWRLVASVIAASPAIASYGVFSGALMARRGAGGLVGVLVTLPLLAPTLIFGTAAVTSEAGSLWASPEIRALLGLSLIAVVIGMAGSVAALKTNSE